EAGPSLPAAVARLLALRKPPGAAEALLAVLPQAEDETLAAEFRSALAAVAFRDGKPEPAVVAALADKSPARRAAAGAALAKAASAGQRSRARKLLKDSDPAVRLHVALALVEARDREAVPVLIALLGELPQDHGWRAEEVLFRVGGDKGPNVALGSEGADR